MKFYKVMHVVNDIAISLHPNFKSITTSNENAEFAIRGLDGNLKPATEELFIKIMDERKYVELIEYPNQDNCCLCYHFLITTVYVN